MPSSNDSASQKKGSGTRCSRINKNQVEELINYMKNHPGFAQGKQLGYDGTRTKDEMWEEVASILNKLGSEKTVDQWSTSWRDLKSKAMGKAAALRKDRATTGNKPATAPPLTENEKKIVGIFGVEYAEGSAGVPDTLPEEGNVLERLLDGESIILDVDPLNSQQGMVIVQETARNIKHHDSEDEELVDDPWQNAEAAEEVDSGPGPSGAGKAPSTPIQDPYLRRSKVLPRKKTPKDPSKERIGVQLERARSNFEKLCGNQTTAMQMLAEANLKMADAAKMQAEAAKMQADATMLQAENEKRRIELQAEQDRRLVGAYTQMTDVMSNLLGAINNLSVS